ncbi:hypothetical protein [Janibacter anophelis]|uniref:hypothetical protein n=1 Tax=Janibacter anophelis TaxID=319054 RepID=UPI000DEEB98A|nr:hypothetical protein [Janibacter anophelis]
MSIHLHHQCSKPGCAAPTFMDSDRCFDHAPTPGLPSSRSLGAAFIGWFVFVALVALVLVGLFAWAAIELVTWATR